MSMYNEGRVTLICELSHNANGSFERSIEMVEAAADAGADAIKVQVRTIPDDLPDPDKRKVVPWTGEEMSYAEYRQLCEYTPQQLSDLADLTRGLGMRFGASCWGMNAVDTLCDAVTDGPDFFKAASASMTDLELIEEMSIRAWDRGIPLLLSSGGCELGDIEEAVQSCVAGCDLWLAQCTAEYPCRPEHLDIGVIDTMRELYPDLLIGLSNHGVSVAPIVGAVALGARWVELHFTLDRSLPGTDHAASFEPSGVRKVRSYVDTMMAALGDGTKRVHPAEAATMAKLRRVS